PQIVPATPLKLVEQPGGPVRLPWRIVHLVRIVEERAQPRERPRGQGAIESAEIPASRVRREMIDDKPLAARGSPLDELAVPAAKDAVHRRRARRRPVEHAV